VALRRVVHRRARARARESRRRARRRERRAGGRRDARDERDGDERGGGSRARHHTRARRNDDGDARRARRARGTRGRGRASNDGDARGGRFYAYDARTWRAFEDAFGRWPAEAWFAPLQASIAIALAGVVDAGYSGDWSRVGALTTEQEAWTRRFVAFVAVAHGVVGAIARDVALKRGADATSANAAFAKTFVVGFVGLVEAAFGGDDEDA
jgi:hypothetical protein